MGTRGRDLPRKDVQEAMAPFTRFATGLRHNLRKKYADQEAEGDISYEKAHAQAQEAEVPITHLVTPQPSRVSVASDCTSLTSLTSLSGASLALFCQAAQLT